MHSCLTAFAKSLHGTVQPAGHRQPQQHAVAVAGTAAPGTLAPAAATPLQRAQQQLTADITPQEVLAAVRNIRPRTSPGPDGIGAQFWQAACYKQETGPSPALAATARAFTSILATQAPPQQWAAGLLCPVYKKQSAFTWANYRPIVVTDVGYRLFMGVMRARLSAFCEQQHVLPDEQFGFRPGRSTVQAAFILHHYADLARAGRLRPNPTAPSHLYAALLDLEKAYDSINREAMWRCMTNAQLPPPVINMLRSIYADTYVHVKLHGLISLETLDIGSGVRQGCPLSPLLFNVCLAGLPQHLQTAAGEDSGVAHTPDAAAGPMPAQQPTIPPPTTATRVRCLLYADDIALLAHSAAALQQLLTATAQFCEPLGLRVSASKSQVVVFRPPAGRVPAFTWKALDGTQVPCVHHGSYLGVAMHETKGRAFAMNHRINLAHAATVKCQAAMLHMHCGKSVAIALYLLQYILRPALSYAAEISAIHCISPNALSSNAAEVCLLGQLRKALHVDRCTPRPVVYHECAQSPLPADWLVAACRLYNTMHSHESGIMRDTMRYTIHEGLCPNTPACRRAHTWGAAFAHALAIVGYPDAHNALSRGSYIDPAAAKQCFMHAYTAEVSNMTSDPVAPVCSHRRISTYFSYFANAHDQHLQVPWYISHVHSAPRQHLLAQLRCGCSDAIPADFARRTTTQFTDRQCCFCGGAAIGHVAHVCLHCPAPPLVHARSMHGWPTAIHDMHQLMHCADACQIYDFLTHVHAAALSFGLHSA